MKKNINYLLIWMMGLFPLAMHSQSTFQQIYPTSVSQSGRDVIPTSDGGYLIAAMTKNAIPNDTNIFIMKTDALGNTVWTKTYGGPSPDYVYSVVPTSDNHYILAGYTASYGAGDYDTYLLKIDAAGDTAWAKTYGGIGDDQGKEIIATADGNFLVVGRSDSQSLGNMDAYLMKINSDGVVLWTKYYGGSQYETGRSLTQCADGGYAFIGLSYQTDNAYGDIYLVRTTATGDTLWTKTFGGANIDDGNQVLENSDGTFTLVAETKSFGAGDFDVQMLKTTSGGTLLWNKTYGGTDKDISHMMQHTNDGGYIIAAISRSFGWIDPDMWLIKTNNAGDTLWTRRYGSWDHEHCYAARQMTDNSFIVLGHSKSYGPAWRIMFLKLNAMGGSDPLSVNGLQVADVPPFYPNPTEGPVHIRLGDIKETVTIRVSNMLGQQLFSEVYEPDGSGTEKIIDLKGKEPGVYIMTLDTPLHNSNRKIVLK